jgi:hypothetical protein
VYLGGKSIERPMTPKELCQLVDLREDWGETLVAAVWAWDGGTSPPLRMLVQFGLAARPWLRGLIGLEAREGEKESCDNKVLDWGRVRAPWLGIGDAPHFDRMHYYGWEWGDADAAEAAVACRADDAQVELALWAVGGEGKELEEARGTIRNFLHSVWRKRLGREARGWLRTEEAKVDFARNTIAVRDCITRCARSTWWDWSDGSRLLFWRWPARWRIEARDGAIGFHTGKPLARLHYPPPPAMEEKIRRLDREKLEKLLRRRYVTCGPCRNTVPRFAVPKGSDDIRVVWDLKKNGVNAPSFFLPTVATYLRRLDCDAYSGDFDIGEQFHNYMLHPVEQIYCGVHIPKDLVLQLCAEGLIVEPLMRWSRLVFGWQSSPYLALRMLAQALEVAVETTGENVFQIHQVLLNLPGQNGYDPSKPRLIKLRVGGIASADIIVYFDDARVFGPSQEIAQQGMRQVTSRLQNLGNQDAARKRRGVSQRPGAWAGGIVYTDQGLMRKLVGQSKWDKAKRFLEQVRDAYEEETKILRGDFLSGTGFLLHIAQTYEFMQPYLKGFHLAAEAWREDRDAEGCKQVKQALDDWDPDEQAERLHWAIGSVAAESVANDQAPGDINKIPLLRIDVDILLKFFSHPNPVQVIFRLIRGAAYVAYGAGDASGEGFGSNIHPLGLAPLLRHGFWCTEDSEQSSNWRELRNLVDAVRVEAESGRLAGRELWLATDNSTAAAAYHHGAAGSPRLHQLATELRMLTLVGNFVLNIFHVAGTRMIEIGVDGLSRGEKHIGALLGTPQSAAPLHLSPLERAPLLRAWLEGWIGEEFRVAEPIDWFHAAQHTGQDGASGVWVWDLPPGAALAALEELGTARLKRHEQLQGVVLVPQLLQNEWRRRFCKIVDFYFVVPAGAITEWPANMHEALTVGIYLPLCRYRPWSWKRVPFVVPLGIALSKMHKTGDPTARDLLRKIWRASARVAVMPESVVRDVLQSPGWHRLLTFSGDGQRRDGVDGAG